MVYFATPLLAEMGRGTSSKNLYGTIASMLTNKGNSYGRVLRNVEGTIRIHPAIEEEVRKLMVVLALALSRRRFPFPK